MMKPTTLRLLALTLAAALLLALAACGGKQEDVAGTIEPGPSAAAPTGSVDVPTSDPDPTEEATDGEETAVSLGRIEGGVYTNSYAGFGCELDANWEFYSAEELQELPANVQELLEDTELGDAMSELTMITDMKAENAQDLTTMNVQYTKLDAQTRLAYLMLSEEEIVDLMLEQSEILSSSYGQLGIEVESMEKAEVDFLGEKHFGLRTNASQYGIPCYILQLFDYTRGSYGITTTFWSYGEDTTADLAGLFYAVD